LLALIFNRILLLPFCHYFNLPGWCALLAQKENATLFLGGFGLWFY